MMSAFLQKKYEEAYSAFESVVVESKFSIRHRSLKKYEDKTNQDIYFLLNDKTVCAVYVGKDSYKIWTNNPIWRGLSKRNPTEIRSDGYYDIFCDDLEECIDEVKNILIRSI